MSGCLNKLIPKMILIIVALLLVAAVGGAITEDGNQDAFDTAMGEMLFVCRPDFKGTLQSYEIGQR